MESECVYPSAEADVINSFQHSETSLEDENCIIHGLLIRNLLRVLLKLQFWSFIDLTSSQYSHVHLKKKLSRQAQMMLLLLLSHISWWCKANPLRGQRMRWMTEQEIGKEMEARLSTLSSGRCSVA